MLIYIIHNDYIYTYRLPKEIGGNYMLNDIDVNGRTRSLINISGEDGKWIFNSNDEVSVFYNGGYNEKAEIKPYSFYTLTYYEKENILLYVLPGYDKSYVIKEISNNSTILIGNGQECDIIYESKSIDAKQVQLDYNNGSWKCSNLNEKTPMYINKKRDTSTFIDSFDSLFIMGLKITVVGNKLIIGFIPGTLRLKEEKLLSDSNVIAVEDNPSKEIAKEYYSMYDYFYKSPIFKKKYDEYHAIITPPDAKEKNTGNNIISEIVPSALMSVSSLVSLYFAVSNGGSYVTSPETAAQYKETLVTSAVMCIIMLVTGIAWPIIEHLAARIRRFVAARVRVFNYRRYLKRKDEELKGIIEEEKNVLFFNNLSLKECQEAITKKNSNLFGRNIESESFLNIKCGEGKVPSSIVVEYQKPDLIVQNDKLYDEIDNLLDKYKYIEDASFVFNLKNTSLAVIDSTRDYSNYLNSIILQLITLHDYNNLKLVVLTHEGSTLNSIRNLNHVWNNERSFRYFATNLHEAENISTELTRIWNNNNVVDDENKNKSMVETYYVIISDCIEDYKGLKIINTILKSNKNKENINCMSLLMFTDRVTNIPNGCEYFINYDNESCSFFNSEMDEKNITKFKPNILSEDIDYYGCVENLCNIPIKVNSENSATNGSLPSKLGFLEMYGVGKIEQLNIIEKWKNAPIASTLAAPVGIDSNNNVISLDLHEKKHGPHGLVAGMTGSGKSEFIITYILSLAINYSPDEVQFVLIDYKGGGLAGAFENKKNGIKLPHLVGTITNLDKAEMNRTLVSIKSELQRRQKVFNQAKDQLNTGSIDIYKYQVLVRDGTLTEPMSHLFIICDEFAELKAQQPEFMDELVSAARIGRSLGIHLILATQKPAGVVDDQIWSNSKFKVCCKVQTADDSHEMLRKDDAAYIKESGRFYLQVGYDEYYVLGQSGYSGVQYIPSETVVSNIDNSISFINNNGEIYRNSVQKIENKEEDKKASLGEELNNILRYIIKVSEENGYKYNQLWLDNVPKRLLYADLVKKYKGKAESFKINPIIGEYDDPENQSQGCVNLPITGSGNTFIIGNSGSGKATLLQTIVFSSIINHSTQELNFYILDFGSEKFNNYLNAPQVGDILGINDKQKMRYFFYMIDSEVKKRQKYYSQNGGEYMLDVNNGRVPFPNIVVLLYGVEVFRESFDTLYDGLFSNITRNCSKVGIEFIVTCSSVADINPQIENNFKQKVVLQLTDEGDYSYILKNAKAPAKNPGRGVILNEGVPVEFQTALIFDEERQKEYLDSVFVQLNNVMKEKVHPVPEVPKKVSIEELLPMCTSLDNIPLGINVVTAQQEFYDFNKTINILVAAKMQNTVKFFSKFTKLLLNIPDTNIIFLNKDAAIKLNLDERIKYYDGDFSKIVNLLNTNCLKINDNPTTKKFIVIICGYSSINKTLDEASVEDETVVTLDQLINNCKNDNFKFLIYDSDEKYERVLNSDISDKIDNSNGIWIGVDYDSQSSLEMAQLGYDDNPVNPSNELIIVVRDSEPSIVRFPTI